MKDQQGTNAETEGLLSTQEACKELGINYHMFIHRTHTRRVRPVLSIRNKHWWHLHQLCFLFESEKEHKQTRKKFYEDEARKLLEMLARTDDGHVRLAFTADFLSGMVVRHRQERDPEFCRTRILELRRNGFTS
jgi:hypothetical protein